MYADIRDRLPGLPARTREQMVEFAGMSDGETDQVLKDWYANMTINMANFADQLQRVLSSMM